MPEEGLNVLCTVEAIKLVHKAIWDIIILGFFFFFFLLHLRHAEVPRPGIEPAPQQ